MSILTRFLDGLRPQARMARRRRCGLPVVTAELGNVQPIVASIDDNGTRHVGLVLERGAVSVEARVTAPRELHDTLAKAIAWQEGDDDA